MDFRRSNFWKGYALLAATLVSAPLFATEAPMPPRGELPRVEIEHATIKTADGREIPYELGTLYVPENRSNPRSRTIGVGFARFKSSQSTGAPPTFHLPGGPGGTALDKLNTPQALQKLQYLTVGDLVIVEQRGYTTRGEQLVYQPKNPNPLPLGQPTSLDAWKAAAVDKAREAVAEFTAKGVDLSGYSVLELADDVNDVRRALGYPKITLVGQSFGSQLSFAIMRRHPQIVARALLSGVEPLNNGYDMPSHLFATLQRMAWDIDKNPQAQAYLPPDGSGLMGAVREVMSRLRTAPISVQVKDPKTNQVDTVVLGVEDFQLLLAPTEPAAIMEVYNGRYDRWAQQIRNIRLQGGPNPDKLIAWLIDSSLGVTPERNHLLHTDPAVEFRGTWIFDPYIATADIWPSKDVGDDFRTPILNRTPVLFIHGDWDASTPVENTLGILPYFPNGRAIIVHRGPHSARDMLESTRPDVMQKVFEFLRSGRTEQLPVTLELPAPPMPPLE